MIPEENHGRPFESSAAILEAAQRGKAAFDTMYPEDRRREKLIDFVSRLNGPIPDAYDLLALGVYLEESRILRAKALATIDAMNGTNGSRPISREERDTTIWFNPGNIGTHPIVRKLEDLTVSLGGGRGRKEGVELGKSNPPVEPRSRWSWGGRHDR